MSFPAAAADPSVIDPDDPAAGRESARSTDPADVTDPAAEPGSRTDPGDAGEADPAQARANPHVLPDEAVALARAAAVEEAGDGVLVGDYLGAVSEDDVAVTASFEAGDRGYHGWYWSVTLAMVDPERQTISEVVLLPGERALLAPAWVPWEKRIRGGDVGAGDLLPTAPDDPRLVPGYTDSDDPSVKELEYEFGFGRVRVLSREGRDEAAQRWHDGPFGPDAPIAQAAPATCVSCGFYVQLAGLLGMALGGCTNEFSPADGHVVDAQYGCGAHSETTIKAPLIWATTATVVDELTLEVHRRPVQTVSGDAESTGPVEVAREAADSAPDEQAADQAVPVEQVRLERAPDEETADEQAVHEQVVDEEVLHEQDAHEPAPDEVVQFEQPADEQAVNEAVPGEQVPHEQSPESAHSPADQHDPGR